MSKIYRYLVLAVTLCTIQKSLGNQGSPLTNFLSDRQHVKHLRFSTKEDINPKNFMPASTTIDIGLAALTGSFALFVGPSIASAIAEPSAREALQLLSGYQTRTPNFFTWGTLAVLAYVLAFEVWKKILAAW